jgi:mono/diheme cytochrome c family protein
MSCSSSSDLSGEASAGEQLYNQTFIGENRAPGCITCHPTVANQQGIGPSMAGIGTQTKDELRMDIVDPAAELTEGYSNLMYPNYGEDLTDEEIDQIIAYLQTLQ